MSSIIRTDHLTMTYGVNIKELPLDEESCVDVLMEVLK